MATDAKTSRTARRAAWLAPPVFPHGTDHAARAEALGKWLVDRAAPFLANQRITEQSKAPVARGVDRAWLTVLAGLGTDPSPADIREAVENRIRHGGAVLAAEAPWPKGKAQAAREHAARERDVIGDVRAVLAGIGRADAVTDKMILEATHAVNNRGGRGGRTVKLRDALDAIWKALGVRSSDPARTRRARLKR